MPAKAAIPEALIARADQGTARWRDWFEKLDVADLVAVLAEIEVIGAISPRIAGLAAYGLTRLGTDAAATNKGETPP